jgi:hypothetical protein
LKFFIYLLIFCSGFGIGTYFGFKKAPTEFLQWDSQFKASILAYENTSLKSGNIQRIIEANEINLNGELAMYGRHLGSSLFWLLKLTGNYNATDDEPIKNAVKYRNANPFIEPDMSKPSNYKSGVDMNSPIIKEIISDQIENRGLRNKVLDLYSNNIKK